MLLAPRWGYRCAIALVPTAAPWATFCRPSGAQKWMHERLRPHPRRVEELAQDVVRVEVRFRDRPRRLRVAVVISGDPPRPLDRLFDRRERDQSLPRRQVAGEPGFLHQRRLGRGEVAHGAVAEPAAVGLDVDTL